MRWFRGSLSVSAPLAEGPMSRSRGDASTSLTTLMRPSGAPTPTSKPKTLNPNP